MVITIMGVITAVIAPLIGNKFGTVAQSTQRAKWVAQAEFALFKIRQDLASSVPNSIEVLDGGLVVEFLGNRPTSPTVAARYRELVLSPYEALDPSGADLTFDVFGNFDALPSFVSIGAASVADLRTDWESQRIGGTSGVVAEIDSLTNSTGENSAPITTITLDAAHTFNNHSPYFRAYFTDGPVAYQCDVGAGFLYRVSGYDNFGAAAFSTRRASGDQNIVFNDLVGCNFTFSAGTTNSPPTLSVEVSIGNAQESITLIDHIVLSNAL